MPRLLDALAIIGLLLAAAPAGAQIPGTAPNAVTAIDILLNPDATMLARAKAANDRLRKVYPRGFSLDASHTPHITLLQRHVRTADLDRMYAALDRVFAGENVTTWKLEAFKYYYAPAGDIGVAGIVIRPTPELRRLQQELVEAVAPFTVATATSAAYATTPEDSSLVPGLIEYVSSYVPEMTGKKMNPHVSVGAAPQDYLKGMLAEPFEAFTFSPAGASVYQLGNFGTARKRLKTFAVKP